MPDDSYQTLDVSHVRRVLSSLHEQVVRERSRVQIRRRGCDDLCVMISKTELEGLERALEILSNSEQVRQMQETMARFAAAIAAPPLRRPLVSPTIDL